MACIVCPTCTMQGRLCIVRSEVRMGHEGQSVHEARSAGWADVTEWPLSASDLTMHDTPCLNPIMTWIIWFWYITKPKFASEVPEREVANHALYQNDFGVTESAQNMVANMCKWEIILIVRFVSYVSIVLIKINDNLNKNSCSIL